MTDQFLKANNYEITNSSVIPNLKPIKKGDLDNLMKINTDAVTFGGSVLIEGLLGASEQAEDSNVPRQISQQPILEAARGSSGLMQAMNTLIESAATNADSVVGSLPENLERLGELTSDPSKINDKELKECINRNTEKCKQVIEAASNNFASGNVFVSPNAKYHLAANGVSIASETSIFEKAPYFNTLGQDIQVTANNSLSQHSDLIYNKANTQIGINNTEIHQSQDSLTVATESNTSVAKNMSTTGVQTNNQYGGVVSVVADSNLTTISGEKTGNYSYGDYETFSEGNVTLVASAGRYVDPNAHPPHAGDDTEESREIVEQDGGNISIVAANYSKQAFNIIEMASDIGAGGGISTTSTGNLVNVAKEIGILASSSLQAVAQNTAIIGTANNSTLFSNGRTYIGFPYSVYQPQPPQPIKLADLPAFPSLPTQKLENCIPDRFKQLKRESEKRQDGSIELDGNIEAIPNDSGPINNPGDQQSNNLDRNGNLITSTGQPGITPGTFGTTGNNRDVRYYLGENPNTRIGETTFYRNRNPQNAPIFKLGNITLPDIVDSNGQTVSGNVFTNSSGYSLDPDNPSSIKIPPHTDTQTEEVESIPKWIAPRCNVDANCYPNHPDNYSKNFSETLNRLLEEGNLELEDTSDLTRSAITITQNELEENFNKYNIPVELASEITEDINNLFKAAIDCTTSQCKSIAEFLNKEDITDSDLPSTLSPEAKKKFITLLKEHPKLKQVIKDLIDKKTIETARGFFGLGSILSGGGLGDLLGNITGVGNIAGIGISEVINVFNPNANSPIGNIGIFSDNTFGVIYKLLSPFVNDVLKDTGLDTFTDLDSLIGIGTDLLSGNTSSLEQTLVNLGTNLLEEQLTKLLPGELSNISSLLTSNLQSIIQGTGINEDQILNTIISTLENSTGEFGDILSKGRQIYEGIQPVLDAINNKDYFSLISDNVLENLISTALGNENTQKVNEIFNVLRDGLGLAQSLEALPRLLELMDDYNIPGLEQINIALGCLDLFNKVSDVINGVSDLFDGEGGKKDLESARLIEDAPRLTQIINTLDRNKNIKKEVEKKVGKSLDINLPVSLDPCYRIPKLTVAEATVEIIQVLDNNLIFKVNNLPLLYRDLDLIPKVGNILRIKVSEFYDSNTNTYLTPYQTEFQFTPSVYNFIINDFNPSINLGVAYYSQDVSRIVLQVPEGELREYPTTAIGKYLIPEIIDSYLVG